jgi:hypothetical protein
MKTMKIILVIAALFLAGEARASIVSSFDPTTGWPAGSITQQDKVWTFVSQAGMPTGYTYLTFNVYTYPNEPDAHSLTIGNSGTNPLPVGNVVYTIAVAPGYPYVKIVEADLDVNADGSRAAWSVTKNLYTDSSMAHLIGTLHQDQGQTGTQVLTFPGVTSLYVVETISYTPLTRVTLIDTTNTYIQATIIPEPSTLLVWSGLGAVGLIAAWRSRRRVA